jgi:hypothetical protein
MANIAHWRRHVNDCLLTDSILSNALSAESVEAECRSAGYRWRVSFWSPPITLLTFVLQVLSAEKTLRAAVAALLIRLAAQGRQDLPSQDPTAYCQARQRLPGQVITAILAATAQQIHKTGTAEHRWLGRRVRVFDGSTASMPDTPELQEAFPQPSAQKPGCGFPVAQFVAMFCWSTGAVLDVEVDTLRPHELTLFRKMWHHFKAGDVVLADRAYGAYVDMARLRQRGVDCVFRLHQRRMVDWRRGKRLGPGDRLVTLKRPAQYLPSCGISRREFRRLPETLTVRLVRIKREQPGARTREMTIVTTLTDPVEVPADKIRSLYRDRWTAELNLRSLKTALKMEVLRGESPDVVRKEIAVHLLVYNLIRLLMWQAAVQHGRDLHRLSFTGTLHRIRAALPYISAMTGQGTAYLLAYLIQSIADDHVPHRPDRVEPRRIKRRPKPYDLLTRPRHEYRGRVDDSSR